MSRLLKVMHMLFLRPTGSNNDILYSSEINDFLFSGMRLPHSEILRTRRLSVP